MISITLNIQTHSQLIAVTNLLATVFQADEATPAPVAVEAPKAPKQKKPAAPTPHVIEAAPVEVAAPAPVEAPALTLEQVRAKLAAISQSGKTAEVKELIGKFGAAKFTDIPADKYADLMAAAEAL